MKFILAAFFVSLFALPSIAQQNVLLDFDSGTDGNINYTTSMRDSIQASISDVYEQFDISVFQSAPATGPFSTLTFNSGGQGGVAEDIDFRNLNKSDNAQLLMLMDSDSLATTKWRQSLQTLPHTSSVICWV